LQQSIGVKALSDASVNPKKASVYYIHDQWIEKMYGDFGGEKMVNILDSVSPVNTNTL